MSLTKCIKTAGKALDQYDADTILELRDSMVADGMTQKEAGIEAVRLHLQDVIAEREGIVAQIEEQGGAVAGIATSVAEPQIAMDSQGQPYQTEAAATASLEASWEVVPIKGGFGAMTWRSNEQTRKVRDVGDQKRPADARADARAAIERSRKRHPKAEFPSIGEPDAEGDARIQQLSRILGDLVTGAQIFAYSEPGGHYGFEFRGQAFVNVHPTAKSANIGRTGLHEIRHVAERLAKMGDKAAQRLTNELDSIFDDMTEEGKRAYAENYLFDDRLEGLTGNARAEALEQYMQTPELRSEMVADFLGNRAQDRDFWNDLSKKDPTGFRAFVEKWLAFLDNLSERFRGRSLAGKESTLVDSYINDIEAAKEVAGNALIEYRRSQGETLIDDSDGVRFSRRQVGGFSVKTAKDGSIVVEGDSEAIRAMLPEGVRGRSADGGLAFTPNAAHRVVSALEGDRQTYSRAGEVHARHPMKDGKYVGAPESFNTPAKIPTLRKILMKLTKEGIDGRYWYENSSEAVMRFVGGDKAEARKLVALLAIYSPQAKVDTNSTFAIRAWAQYKAGRPISVKTKVMDKKAQNALDNIDEFWSGEKTGNFFQNLLSQIDDSTAGKQGATIDMWMMRAAQYRTDAPTTSQYRFMEMETNRIAQELGWEPQQVQAAIWVAMKARMENSGVKKRTDAKSEKRGWITFVKNAKGAKIRKILDDNAHRDNWLKQAMDHDPTANDTKRAKFDFEDGLYRHVGLISFESRPGRTTGVLPGIHNASYEQQLEFHSAIHKAMHDASGRDLIAHYLGLMVEGDITAPGIWQGEVSPSSQSTAVMAPSKGSAGKKSVDPAQSKLLNLYTAMAGLIGRQEGVGWHRPFYKSNKGDHNGVELRIGRPLTPDEAQQLWTSMDAVMREAGLPKWEDKSALISSPVGMRAINYGIMGNAEFRKAVDRAVQAKEFSLAADLVNFASDGNLAENNWKRNKNGESFVKDIRGAGRSDLLDWGRDVLAPKIQRVYEEFSERYDWGDPGELKFSRRQRDGRGSDSGRAEAPLPGAPVKQGATGPDPALVEVAHSYAAANGISLRRQAEYVNIDPGLAGRLASAYEAMKHAPRNPAVRAAYAEMIRQTRAQYDALVAAGYQFTFFDSSTDPYGGNPWNALRALRKNKSMAVYGTYDGYGTDGLTGAQIKDNPMLEDTGLRWADQGGVERPVTANDLFRAVHDAFGHGLEGAGFRARGEENAWQAHARLFTGRALAALTTETRGQNSWLNFGPHGETNRTASLEDTVFAEQKIGLLPKWAWSEGLAADEAPAFSRRQTQTPAFKRWFGDSKVVDANGEPLVVYHGSRSPGITAFETGRPSKRFTTFSERDVDSQAIFFSPIKGDAESYGAEVTAAYLSVKTPLTHPSNIVTSSRATPEQKAAAVKAWDDIEYIFAPAIDENGQIDVNGGISTVSVDEQGMWFDDVMSRDSEIDWFHMDNPEVVARMKERGYDGVKVSEPDDASGFSWAVFDPTQIKSATGNTGAFDPDNADIRYSRRWYRSELAEVAQDLPKIASKEGTVKPVQAVMWLRSQQQKGRLKAEELEWSGVTDWLQAQDGDVSVSDIQSFIEDEGVQVEEVQLGGPDGFSAKKKAQELHDMSPEELKEEYEEVTGDDTEGWDFGYADRDQAIYNLMQAYREEAGAPRGDEGDPKFESYTVPGGENYREVLLMLPNKATSQEAEAAQERLDASGLDDAFRRGTQEQIDRMRREAQARAEYRSGHWNQPNVLAHVRVDDRTDADGNRVLFVNEIQSDWGQDGRKKGFNLKQEKAKAEKQGDPFWYAGEMRQDWVVTQPGGAQETIAYPSNFTERDVIPAAQREDSAPIPNAPFVTKTENWTALALKRIIAMAAEGGYDKVAIISGEQAAGLYNLSKQVDSVYIIKNKDGTYDVSAQQDRPSGRGLADVLFEEFNVPLTRVEEVVGKDLAEKAEAQTKSEAEYRGVDLKVGGEGMRGFYDKIVPATLGKVLKKVGGGKVESIALPGSASRDELAAKVYGRGETYRNLPSEGKRRIDSMFDDRQSDQVGFTITDAMRRSVQDGLPLFSRQQQTDTEEFRLTRKAAGRSTPLEPTTDRVSSLEEIGDGDLSLVTRSPEFRRWFGKSKVVDENGEPLVVYRGEHGSGDQQIQTRLGSVTFVSDPEVASTYAAAPNNRLASRIAESPRVIPAYLSIQRPIIDSRDDPFVDLSYLSDKLDSAQIDQLARKHSQYIENTSNWEENFADQYASVGMLLDANPDAVSQLYLEAYVLLDDPEFVRAAQAAGFDGAVHLGSGESMDAIEFRVFSPEQIKSSTGNRGTFDPNNPDIRFSRRTKPAPKNTATAYKLFRADPREPGRLFPLFVDAKNPVYVGVWYDADAGERTEKGKVKSKLGPLAYRPGWHAGDLPLATHIGEGGQPPQFRPANQVWAEVEMPADVDWQAEANKRARRNKQGEPIASTAHITDAIPEDGHYRYKTNPNMTGEWLIGGAMKVVRVLSDAEVQRINRAAGVSDLPRQAPLDLKKYGLDAINDTPSFMRRQNQTDTKAFRDWFGDSRVVDANGDPLVVYHGTLTQTTREGEVMGDIAEFNRLFTTKFRSDSVDTMGSWFTTDPYDTGAGKYAGNSRVEGGVIYPVYLSIQSPHETTFNMMQRRARMLANGVDDGRRLGKAEVDAYRKWLKDTGRDGIKIRAGLTPDDGSIEFANQSVWIALEPSQIKSATGNVGTFDPTNPDIRYSRSAPSLNQAQAAREEMNRRVREEHHGVWYKAKNATQRYFLPGGLLPQEIFQAKVKRDSSMGADELDVTYHVTALEQAYSKDFGRAFGKRTKEEERKMTAALAGRPPADLPQRTATALEAMRQHIDRMSARYIEILQEDAARLLADIPADRQAEIFQQIEDGDFSGLSKKEAQVAQKALLLQTISGNVGEYVHRSYRAFDDALWPRNVPSPILNNARDYLEARFLEQNEGATQEEAARAAQRVINDILKQGTAFDTMEAYIRETKLGAKDLSLLKQRKQIAPAIRALLGEHEDPRVNFAKTFTKMGRLIHNDSFLKRVREIGMGEFLFEEGQQPEDGFTAVLAAEGNESYAPLNGLRTTPEINQAFIDALGKEQLGPVFKKIVQLNGGVKFGKTVLSPTTAMRNFFSAYFFSMANGHFDMSYALMSLRAHRNKNTDEHWHQYFRKMKDLGVVYDTPYAEEMMRLLRDTDMADRLLTGRPTAQKMLDYAQAFYRFGDDFWKVIGFENEAALQMKHRGLSRAEAEVVAAERIRNTYPTYSMTGKFVNHLRRFPLAGTFVSFPAEIIRTTFHILRYAKEDMKHSKALGARRVLSIGMVSGMAYAAQELFKNLLDVDDDEEEAVRNQLPEWSVNSNLLFLSREDGNLRYLDLSFLDPYNYWKRPITAVLRDDVDLGDSAIEAAKEMLAPFFGTDIAFGAIAEIWSNKKSSGGKVYNESDTGWKQTQAIADHLRKAVQPGAFANAERILKAAREERTVTGRQYSMQDEMAALAGFRVSTLDPATSLKYRTFGAADRLRDATSIVSRAARNPNRVSDRELKSTFLRVASIREDTYRDLLKSIKAAEKSGLTRQGVIRQLEAGGLSKKDAALLAAGRVPPKRSTNQYLQSAVKSAGDTFGPDVQKEINRRRLLILQWEREVAQQQLQQSRPAG